MIIRQTFLALLILAAPRPAGSEVTATDEVNRAIPLADGRTIALHCSGEGTFTVLLEPGDGGRRAHLASLFAALSKRYRVCDYDRRNVGGSSSAPLPRKAADLTSDAFDALSAANVRGPYILFGSSMGGLLVRAYAASPSHDVAGFVTSNQPSTAHEWTKIAFPLMSPSQRVADAAWMAGANSEQIDVNDVSRTIDGTKPPTVPHIIMISTERFQCRRAGICGPVYRAFVTASRQLARAGSGGSMRVVDGDHDLYTTNLADVVAAIDVVAVAARAKAK